MRWSPLTSFPDRGPLLRHSRQSEIQHLHDAGVPTGGAGHHHVPRFQIAMHDPFFVRCFERVCDLPRVFYSSLSANIGEEISADLFP